MKIGNYRPVTAVTMGDPAGIGPEIAAECFNTPEIYQRVRPFLVGDETFLRKAFLVKGITLEIRRIKTPEEGEFRHGVVDLLQVACDGSREIPYGKASVDAAKWAYCFFAESVRLGQLGLVDVISTAPLNKESLKQAGFAQADHSAILSHAFPNRATTSMFHCRELKVFHYTRHLSLLDAIGALDVDRLVVTLKKIAETMRQIGYPAPRIAVAALNPHASDNGMFGREEALYLAPAVEICRGEGLEVFGPVPADSVFYQQRQGIYDCVLSLYHDQGHIACKTYDFEGSVSLTFGYPFMRSTVDHGTAYDIAGTGTASCGNLKEAILTAAKYFGELRRSRGEQ